MSQTVTPYLEMSQAIMEAGGEALKKCYQCGTCAGTCPWTPITDFNIRKLVRFGQLGLDGIEDFMWGCSTCKFCVDRCPRGVEIIDVVTAIRNVYSGGGMLPQSLRAFVGSLSARGNPWSGDQAKRNDWAKEKYPLYTKDKEYLFWSCCTVCYDPRNTRLAKATAELLNQSGLSWGLPSVDVNCCGESLKKVGDLELFERLKNNNLDYFKSNGVSKIITVSPHCLASFKKDYGDDYEVLHLSELIARLVKEGKLTPKKDFGGVKVTYHDPCYLGRHSGVYDAPRDVLKSIAGLDFVEMGRNREQSMCCGGGGGGLWMEKLKGERLSDLRIEEALETGASVLATACPYCITMFEDSVRTLNVDDRIKIKDVTELFLESLDVNIEELMAGASDLNFTCKM
ncbi:MAG: cyclic nucleotide-binding protein [Deltaproteobacteria bacterium HGW-Deltaproteobacteria-7]|jgi:Fe-S oxidoreductase|nr:MAG: cyclic nucleotide-binding protein [Deltaproteobacteria bacterium HGW-Deltaproteobacteria-7]PKN50866.1 MAG: cyclic nucleotide-binding protein [Deltaproteobacteria bacterium HGW-Deltaproteobacteria-13]